MDIRDISGIKGVRDIGGVRFTYNEASNAILTGTGSASHMRGSEFCQRKQLCPGYRLMGVSRNSAF